MDQVVNIFLPPSVQSMFWAKGTAPVRALFPPDAEKITKLWEQRNKCNESEVSAIDLEMEKVASEGYTKVCENFTPKNY